MGGRSDKGKSAARYLTGHAAIPMLRWDGLASIIEAPQPYTIHVTTDAKWDRFGAYLRQIQDTSGVPFVIRYDRYVGTVDNAVVGCTLRTFSELLRVYNEQYDRPQKGDN